MMVFGTVVEVEEVECVRRKPLVLMALNQCARAFEGIVYLVGDDE